MGFFISRYWNKEEPGPKADEWWPTDYTPALTVEDWLELLTDKDVFNESSLEIMKRMKDYGGKATCTQLAVKYGETKNFYNTFERICLSRFLGYPTGEYLKPESWRCSMIWSATMGLPLSLEGVTNQKAL